MPLYEFRCPDGSTFEASYPMAQVPQAAPCPECGAEAARRVSAPRLSQAGSSAYRLVDAAARSAHEPEVVSTRLPGARKGPVQRYTDNPLHRKLPRP